MRGDIFRVNLDSVLELKFGTFVFPLFKIGISFCNVRQLFFFIGRTPPYDGEHYNDHKTQAAYPLHFNLQKTSFLGIACALMRLSE